MKSFLIWSNPSKRPVLSILYWPTTGAVRSIPPFLSAPRSSAVISYTMNTILARALPYLKAKEQVNTSRESVQKAQTNLDTYPDHLVLGVRDFDREDVPPRSSMGNRITSAFFKLCTGVACSDTQTGLRGIPSSLIPLALSTKGDRYDYEMNFLMAAVKKVPLVMIPIETVYMNGNEQSHFHPVRDSFLIYKEPLKKVGLGLAAAGLLAVAADIVIRMSKD